MKKISLSIICILCSFLIIGISIYNINKDEHDFFEANITNMLTISIAIFISFLLGQSATDTRKKKDIIDSNINKIRTLLSNSITHQINEDTPNDMINMHLRNIGNSIDLLKNINSSLVNKDAVAYIVMQFDEYSTYIGDHLQEKEILSKTSKELLRYINNIDNKLSEIQFKMHGLN